MENYNNIEKDQVVPVSLFDRIANSIVLKMATIFILILIMLIPMSLIKETVDERKYREQNVAHEIAAKWGKDQVVASPVLIVPYNVTVEYTQKDSKGKEYTVKGVGIEEAYLLPNTVDLNTSVQPEYLKRGIYQSVVYNTSTIIKGDFDKFDLDKLGLKSQDMRWNEAKLVLGVEDLKGLLENPTLKYKDNILKFEKQGNVVNLFPNALVANIPISGIEDTKFLFEVGLNLRGSKSFNYYPLANQTNIDIKGEWNNPSFNGGFLPETRNVTEHSFDAKWSIPSFARKAPQQWRQANSRLYHFSGISLADKENDNYQYYNSTTVDAVASNAADAVMSAADATIALEQGSDYDMVQINFLSEVNNYQKTTRATKYGILIIILTFVSLLFTEIIKKQRIHIIQYILIGAGMVMFYSLLLAISEHLGFNIGYLIAGVSTILLIASFIFAITKDKRTALLFVSILALFYTFIYVLMQLRDYSLIVGTVGVFIILAVLMRISTKINWYNFNKK